MTTPDTEQDGTISRESMDDLVSQGRALPWTWPLAGFVPTAAQLDGQWWAVLDPNTFYQRADDELAAVLERADQAFRFAAANQPPAQPGARSAR